VTNITRLEISFTNQRVAVTLIEPHRLNSQSLMSSWSAAVDTINSHHQAYLWSKVFYCAKPSFIWYQAIFNLFIWKPHLKSTNIYAWYRCLCVPPHYVSSIPLKDATSIMYLHRWESHLGQQSERLWKLHFLGSS